MAITIDEINVLLDLDQKQLDAGIATAQAKMQAAGKKMQSAGRTMSKALSLPIALAGGASVKAFGDFDQAMTESLAIMDDVSSTLEGEMSQAAKDVARNTVIAADEAAESYFFLASAGLNAKQSVEALPQVASFAQAGMFDMKRATDLATDAQKALGLSSEDAEQNLTNLKRVTDNFTRANQLANASVEQFASSMTKKAGNALRNAGKSIEEGTAALAVFASQGIKGNRAGTILARTLNQLQKQSEKNADAYEKLGVSVFDAEGNLRSMADIVQDVERALQGADDQQRSNIFSQLNLNRQAREGIKALVGQSDALRQYEKQLQDASGATQEVADKQLEGFNSQMEMLRNKIDLVAIRFGEALAPTVKKMGEGLARLTGFFQSLTDEQIRNITKWSLLVAAIGPVLFLGGKFVSLGGKIIGVLRTMTTALFGAIKGLASLSAATWGWIAAGLAIAAAVPVIVDNWSDLVQWFQEGFWPAIKKTFKNGIDLLVKPFEVAFHDITASFTDLIFDITDQWANWATKLSTFFPELTPAALGLEFLSAELDAFADKHAKKGVAAINDIRAGWDGAKEGLIATWDEISAGAVGAMGAMKDTWGGMIDSLLAKWDQFQSRFKLPGEEEEMDEDQFVAPLEELETSDPDKIIRSFELKEAGVGADELERLKKTIEGIGSTSKGVFSDISLSVSRVASQIGRGLTDALLKAESAFDALRGTAKRVLQMLISQITAAVVKAAILAPILGALGLGGGGVAAVGVGIGSGISNAAASKTMSSSGVKTSRRGENAGAKGATQGGRAGIRGGQLIIPLELLHRGAKKGKSYSEREGL